QTGLRRRTYHRAGGAGDPARPLTSGYAEPPRDSGHVRWIGLAELRLQRPLLLRHDGEAKPRPPEAESDKDGDAAIEDGPAQPERQLAQVHRMARDRVGAAPQEVGPGPLPRQALGGLGKVQDQPPDGEGGSRPDQGQPEQIPPARA